MLFDVLLLTSLISHTSFGESGKRVRFQPESDETILFFSIDDQSEVCETTFRKDCVNGDGKVCDLIVFYKGAESKIILCLVELKGGDVPKAIDQILSVKRYCLNALSNLRGKGVFETANQIVWKAYILHSGSGPKEDKSKGPQLLKEFGKGNWKISKDPDLSEFIRG